MSVIATEKNVVSNVLVKDLWAEKGYTKDVITYNGAAKSFLVGDLVDTTGATAAVAANIYGIVLENNDAALNTNTTVLVLVKGPASVKAGGLNLGAITAANAKTQLESKGIQVLATV